MIFFARIQFCSVCLVIPTFLAACPVVRCRVIREKSYHEALTSVKSFL